jgi:hypothetical protein
MMDAANSFEEIAEADAIFRADAAKQVWNGDEEAAALQRLLDGTSAPAVADACAATSSRPRFETARAAWPATAIASLDDQTLGGNIHTVIDTLEAPHLQPTGIERRLLDGTTAACMGLITLLNQMTALTPSAAAPSAAQP